MCDAAERGGGNADRLGDDLANAGEYTRQQPQRVLVRDPQHDRGRRHIGTVVLGDKEDLARTAMLNEGHADVAGLGADEETGADVLYEVKCKSALCRKYSAGKGSAALGGQPKSMGHKIGFGNTEEEDRAGAHPRLQEARLADRPTGRGWVAPRKGHYYDALVVKRSRVIARLLSRRAANRARSASRRASSPRARLTAPTTGSRDGARARSRCITSSASRSLRGHGCPVTRRPSADGCWL